MTKASATASARDDRLSRGNLKRCWNCRARKTACDKRRPSCTACQQRSEQCLGYGLKLSWPRADDGRRSAKGYQHPILPLRSRRLEFVNATGRDIEAWTSYPRGRRYLVMEPEAGLQPPVPRALQTVKLGQMDPLFVTNQYSHVSHIVSSVYNEVPELYGLLVRMALADEMPSALAARHAVAALSYQHLGEHEAALVHRAKSLSALQAVIDTLASGDVDIVQALRAMAATMLLSIFETLHFERSALSWTIFFCGCKKIVNLLHTPHATYEGDSALILDWVLYHDTLYKFSIRHWYPKHTQQILLAAQEKIVSKAILSPLQQIILPSTGCSLQLLVLLCQVIDAVRDRTDPDHLSPSHLHTTRRLELRIEALTQSPRVITSTAVDPASTSETTADVAGQQTLAELYRLATHIYLLRMARALPHDDPAVKAVVEKALRLLQTREMQYDGYARPWPLFVIALEARTEEARRMVSDALGAALRRRPLGNLATLRRLVHAAWVQLDLRLAPGHGDGHEDAKRLYDVVVSGLTVPPSFT